MERDTGRESPSLSPDAVDSDWLIDATSAELRPALTLGGMIPAPREAGVAGMRWVARQARAGLKSAGFLPDLSADIETKDFEIEQRGEHDASIPVRQFSSHRGSPIGSFLHLHGGGFMLGDLDSSIHWCGALAQAGFLVLSVGYRLAPEHPFPAGLEDAYAALVALPEIARAVGYPADAIVVGGLSAGGNLTAALSLLRRERDAPPIALQVLSQACLDDRLNTAPMRDPRWAAKTIALRQMWRSYVPTSPDATPGLAAPMREEDLTGLPPAYIVVAELDPLAAEGEAYAGRLRAAGVPVTVDRIEGAFHGFDEAVPTSAAAVALYARINVAASEAVRSGSRITAADGARS